MTAIKTTRGRAGLSLFTLGILMVLVGVITFGLPATRAYATHDAGGVGPGTNIGGGTGPAPRSCPVGWSYYFDNAPAGVISQGGVTVTLIPKTVGYQGVSNITGSGTFRVYVKGGPQYFLVYPSGSWTFPVNWYTQMNAPGTEHIGISHVDICVDPSSVTTTTSTSTTTTSTSTTTTTEPTTTTSTSTTTTTEPTTTTTEPTTTTTEPTTTTSTTVADTTTTSIGGPTTTTTLGTTTTTQGTTTTTQGTTTTTQGTTTTTLGGPSTTTTTPGTTTSTTTGTTTTMGGPCNPADDDCLPNTGTGNLLSLLLAGLGLLFVGVGLLSMADERRRVLAAR